ncbi:MAG: hypothetical protein JSS27_04695 [Planctomycetes bacterium]|nr:hypothetical protein [Planctomycetota bacterium]
MPFRVQCPSCQKFQLLEDEVRGTTTPCLVCRQPMVIDRAAGTPFDTPDPVRQPAPADTSNRIVNCPQCQSKMRVPAAARQVQCPKCRHMFS